MTDIIDTVQLLDSGETFIELFDITLPGHSTSSSVGTFYLFNSGKDNDVTQIEFNQKVYTSIPIHIGGFEAASSGAPKRPTLTIANIPVLTKTVDSSETTLDSIRSAAVSLSITGATQANPVVITTATTHQLENGDSVEISGVVGMTELNARTFYVKVKTSTTLELYTNSALSISEDGTSHTAYTSGGFLSHGEIELPFETNDDLIGTRIVHRQTFRTHTNTNAASAPELPPQTYYIDRISSENNIVVVFELASPMDLEGTTLPAREVIGQYCSWAYQGKSEGRGGGCSWPYKESEQHTFFRTDDTKISGTINEWSSASSQHAAGDIVKTTDGTTSQVQIWEAVFANNGKNPLYHRKYWKRIDLCGKTLNSCKIRFQGYNEEISSINYAASCTISFASSHGFSQGDNIKVELLPSNSSFANQFSAAGIKTIVSVSNTDPNFNLVLDVDTSGFRTNITDIQWDSANSETTITGTDLSGFFSGDPVIIKDIEANWGSVENTIYYLKETSGTYSLYTDPELTTVLDTSTLTAYDSSNPTGTIEVTLTGGYVEKVNDQNRALPFGGFPGAKKFK